MTIKPELRHFDQQPYAAIRATVTMNEMGLVPPQLTQEVFGWLAAKGISPTGAPFIRFLVIDMQAGLELEVGVPTASVIAGDGRVQSGSVPAGRYATLVHTGHPKELMEVTASLLVWAEQHEIAWKLEGQVWGGRFEFYLTDPAVQPDMNAWDTELRFLTAEPSA